MSETLVRLRKLAYISRRPKFIQAFARSRVLPAVDLLPLLDGDYRTVIDVGANRGQFALLARDLWPEASIHSFEPVPAAARALAVLFADDHLLDVHQFALGSQEERRIIHVPSADDGASFFVEFSRSDEVEVPIRILDDVSVGVSRPSLMKMDVQGFELEVLKGAPATLTSIDTVIAECSFDPSPPVPSASELIQHMAEHGFRLTRAVASGQYGDLRFDRAHH